MGCSHVAWSPDDLYLLTASNDHTVRLWTGTPQQRLDGLSCHHPLRVYSKHTDSVTTVGWLNDSKRFVSAGFDMRVFLWDIDGAELCLWEMPGRVQDLCVTFDGAKILIVNSDRKLKLIDVASRRELPPP